MPSGGARSRPGPAPDPNALRRDRPSDGDWKTLPLTGRTARTPAFPLLNPTARERLIWAAEWKRPQALEWEANLMHVEVAHYVRRLAQVELSDASVALGTLVRQMQESLGLSLSGLARNRWRIAAVAPQQPATTVGAHPQPRASSRTRLTVVTAPEPTD